MTTSEEWAERLAGHVPAEEPLRETYVIPFEIVGDVEIVAASPEEARRKFERMSVLQYAEDGELWSGDAKIKEDVP